jgi:hypothetical protein
MLKTKQVNMKKLIAFLIAWLLLVGVANGQNKRIDLSGTWKFAFDRQHTVKPDDVLTETIELPGTTDTNNFSFFRRATARRS